MSVCVFGGRQVGLNYKTMDQSKNDHVMELGKAQCVPRPCSKLRTARRTARAWQR